MKYEKEREYNVILIEIERNLYNSNKIIKKRNTIVLLYVYTLASYWFGKFTYVVCILIFLNYVELGETLALKQLSK